MSSGLCLHEINSEESGKPQEFRIFQYNSFSAKSLLKAAVDFGGLLLLLLLVRLDPAALLGCVVSSPMARRKPGWGHALRRPGQRQVGALLLTWDTGSSAGHPPLLCL